VTQVAAQGAPAPVGGGEPHEHRDARRDPPAGRAGLLPCELAVEEDQAAGRAVAEGRLGDGDDERHEAVAGGQEAVDVEGAVHRVGEDAGLGLRGRRGERQAGGGREAEGAEEREGVVGAAGHPRLLGSPAERARSGPSLPSAPVGCHRRVTGPDGPGGGAASRPSGMSRSGLRTVHVPGSPGSPRPRGCA